MLPCTREHDFRKIAVFAPGSDFRRFLVDFSSLLAPKTLQNDLQKRLQKSMQIFIKLLSILGSIWDPFWDPFWEAKVAETQGIQMVFALFCTRKGARFGALFGPISGPFLVHFGRFWEIHRILKFWKVF